MIFVARSTIQAALGMIRSAERRIEAVAAANAGGLDSQQNPALAEQARIAEAEQKAALAMLDAATGNERGMLDLLA
jgi:hypothetical protein